jgi:hypothetical protein
MLLRFIILVVCAGIGWLFLNWAMPALGIPPIAQTVVVILFVLILIVGLLGLFGIGPGVRMWGSWGGPGSPTP